MFGRIVIAGGSGFLGQTLIGHLRSAASSIVVLTRSQPRTDGAVKYVHWDAKTVGPWATELDGADAIVNLVGRTVDCRKTPANKAVILNSRLDSVRALAAAWRTCKQPPRTWVQSATAHIFGDTHDELLDESSPTGTGFAPDVGRAWEQALADEDLPGCRKVVLRISFVLGKHGGALQTLATLARRFMGGTVGSGQQYISWIHEHDLCAFMHRAIVEQTVQGVYVVTAPQPVTNRDFMRELRHAVRRPWSPPAPVLAVRLASRFMSTDPELALLGRRCVPTRLLREGFMFQFPELHPALHDLLR